MLVQKRGIVEVSLINGIVIQADAIHSWFVYTAISSCIKRTSLTLQFAAVYVSKQSSEMTVGYQPIYLRAGTHQKPFNYPFKTIFKTNHFTMKKVFVSVLVLSLLSGVALGADGGKKKTNKKAKMECTKNCTKNISPPTPSSGFFIAVSDRFINPHLIFR